MYQLEVKRYLVEHAFHPQKGWQVNVDVDGMELAKGGRQPEGKRKRVSCACEWLKSQGVRFGRDLEFGRADLVARKPKNPTAVIEAEGDSSRQKEQALYSALGQILLQINGDKKMRCGIAVPDTPGWECQLNKIPEYVRRHLPLSLWLVSKNGVREPG